ncbi:uncharacterized protein LOC125370895 isoform X2 [Ricinus communis]|nr:uncharacterized protein LOC125370895 isoform X2 [Ricinus communis]XP_048234286.1 uncharacterized protein LOC125370895 isoform X2 [Ricinus communis]XP_048234287.1 uncharacterized protein LOC125370895 isoform X2 [Ricinus communis]XP_048234288.1 uncharacterized protein LOC125370895 isoform X2 [Ricinus communis]XP_048234291.1 uncharacterized protein LOC125370895 isoform X2 [Ricinus communis]
MLRTRATSAAASAQEGQDEFSAQMAPPAPARGTRRRGRPRAVAQPDQSETQEVRGAGGILMEAFVFGMTGMQRALEQLLAFQQQQAVQGSGSRVSGSGIRNPDNAPMSEYTKLRHVEFDGQLGTLWTSRTSRMRLRKGHLICTVMIGGPSRWPDFS